MFCMAETGQSIDSRHATNGSTKTRSLHCIVFVRRIFNLKQSLSTNSTSLFSRQASPGVTALIGKSVAFHKKPSSPTQQTAQKDMSAGIIMQRQSYIS